MGAQPVKLSEEQFKKLVDVVSVNLIDHIDPLVEERFSAIDRKINSSINKTDTLQHTVDTFGKEASDDRNEIGEIRIKVSTIETRVKQLADMFASFGQEIVDGISTKINKQEDRLTEKIEENVPQKIQQAVKDAITPRRKQYDLAPVTGKRSRIKRVGGWIKKGWRR